MLVKFKCLRSGNIVSFKNEADIESMRKEDGYEEIKDELRTKTQTEKEGQSAHEAQVKKRGRPKKGN